MVRASFYAAVLLAGGAGAQSVIKQDSYFYGQSPPVYPSPPTAKEGKWADAIAKAETFVSKLTIQEKVNLTAGAVHDTGCAGIISPIERLSFPGMCLHDAGHGVHNTDFVHSWSSNIHVGASWNKELAHKRAAAMAGEFKRKGVNIMLGPSIGPLGRVVTGGRAWEAYSIDPYLSGTLIYETVAGVQERGVITSTKHFIAQEQEMYRSPTPKGHSVSSNIDDATMHELYLWPFQDAVHAGTGNIMCSYQRVNNSYSCQNSKALNGLLKTELGFQGFVISDWNAMYSGASSALAGLDMAMPGPGEFWGPKLVEAIENGTVPESRLNDMAVRIITPWYRMKQDKGFPNPGIGIASNLALPHPIVEARDAADKPILLQSAVEGHVLVKNVNNALPLKKPKMLSILGYSAKASDTNMVGNPGPSAWNVAWQPANAGDLIAKLSHVLAGFYTSISQIALNGTIVSGGGSGATSLATFFSPFHALTNQADEDDTQIFWDFTSPNPEVVGVSDACLVFGNAYSTEAFDRAGLRDDYTDGLILNVAKKCPNTIVVLHNAGTRLVDQWIDHPNVTAVIFGHLPGQDTGKALVSLLYGRDNFSGKLPYTVAKNETDYGELLSHTPAEGKFSIFPQSNFSEGVYVDYRRFDREGTEPRYEFGFGLSYTTFSYSNLKIRNAKSNHAEYPSGRIVEGGQADLWDTVAVVTVEVKNTGRVSGAEAAQLYVGIPGRPARQLRGFDKPAIKPGKTTKVTFKLNRRDLSVWDTVAQKWRLQSGEYKIFVGSSSRKLPLKGVLKID
ncbi:glycoside hydrolase family 3 protein [Dactylonectria macrodidyma]|uniref:beta-glucosidase n=1 Tax=Dactylonectria macrodidyma TaxID=307937 RepID=A0A9P9D0Q1_9HYPO|nr:glycoside hydrolase family 3 protein [Dactylonectria macrodidyma]